MQTLRILAMIAIFLHAGCSGESPPSNPEKIVDSDTSAEGTEWYFLVLDVQIGPLSESELREEAARGRFRRDARVWTESLDEWQNLDTALPGITIGGSEEDGETWTRIFRRKSMVPEPLIPGNRTDYTPNELSQYLQQGSELLEALRAMPGRHGPEPDLNSSSANINDGRLGLGRQLARLLRHDIADAIATGDKDRAIADIKALCALARQMAICPAYPDPREGMNSSEEYFSYPRLVSIATVQMIAGIIVNPENATWADDFKSTAGEHLGWIDPMLRKTYLGNQQQRSEYRRNRNIQERSEVQAIQAMTRELMGGA